MTSTEQAVPVDCRACQHVRDIEDGVSVRCACPDKARDLPWFIIADPCNDFEPSAVLSAVPLFMGAKR